MERHAGAMNRPTFLSLSVLTALASSCAPKDAPSGKLEVVATTGMIADVARNVGGESISVYGIIGEGVDPHLYKPTAQDVKKLQASDVILYNGLKLEGKMGDVLAKIQKSGKTVSAVAGSVVSDPLPGDDGHADPHVWMDPEIWSGVTKGIAHTLGEADPDNAKVYEENLSAYSTQLAALNDYAAKAMATIPEDRRVLVTAHDAFGYFASAYGLEVRGIQGFSTESEAGVRDIEDLVTYLVEKKIPAVFVETSVSDKNIRALIEGAEAKGNDVSIGGSLFSDAMGQEGTYEGTYIGMIDHNVTTIVRALGGDAPEGGFQGKLAK